MTNNKCFECGEKTNLEELKIFEGDCSSCYHYKHDMEEIGEYIDSIGYGWQPIAN